MHDVLHREIQVTDEMLDYNRHVNNIVFVHWMQDVAVEHATVNGCTKEVYERLKVSWVARSHHIDYLASALPGDTVIAKTWLADNRKVSCRRKYLFFRKNPDGRPGDLLAKAETEWVFVNSETGRPMKIDPWVTSRFRMLGETPDEIISD